MEKMMLHGSAILDELHTSTIFSAEKCVAPGELQIDSPTTPLDFHQLVQADKHPARLECSILWI